jgi:hypothetical protein
MANDEVGHDWWAYAGTAGSTPLAGTALKGIADCSFADSLTTIDTSVRNGGGNKTYSPGLKDFSFSGSCVCGTTGYTTLLGYYVNKTKFAMGMKSQGTSADGVWADCVLSEFSITPPVDGLATASFKAVPQGAVSYV